MISVKKCSQNITGIAIREEFLCYQYSVIQYISIAYFCLLISSIISLISICNCQIMPCTSFVNFFLFFDATANFIFQFLLLIYKYMIDWLYCPLSCTFDKFTYLFSSIVLSLGFSMKTIFPFLKRWSLLVSFEFLWLFFTFLVLVQWLGPLVQCWKKIMRVSILVFLISQWKHLIYHCVRVFHKNRTNKVCVYVYGYKDLFIRNWLT